MMFSLEIIATLYLEVGLYTSNQGHFSLDIGQTSFRYQIKTCTKIARPFVTKFYIFRALSFYY